MNFRRSILVLGPLVVLSSMTARAADVAVPAAATPVPAGGQSVLAPDWAARALQRHGKGNEFGVATRSEAGLLLTSTKLAPADYKIDVGVKNEIALAKGQPMLLRFAARAVKPAEMTGSTQLSLAFQKASPDWFKSFGMTLQLNDHWQRFDVPFKMLASHAPGEAVLNFAFGFAPQVAEIADVQLIAYPAGTDVASLPRTQAPVGTPDPKDYADAVARIVEFRKQLDARLAAPIPLPGRTIHAAARSPAGGDGSAAKPFATIQAGVDVARPGDTVLVAPGLYDEYDTKQKQNHTLITLKGRPDAWISIRAADGPARPKIVAPTWCAIRLSGAAYVEVKGFDVEGRLDPMSEESGNGIGIIDQSHHIRMIDNVVHGFGGAGIYASKADYVHLEGNTTYHTSHGSTYGTSGISLYQCVAVDDAPGWHNVIRRNVSYDNENLKPFRYGGGQITDGNGIIVDDFRHTQHDSTFGPYKPYTLIENNLVYGNGGRGIHSFLSDHVDAINNTIYMDQRTKDIRNGDLTAIRADGMTFFNNVVVARSDLRAIAQDGSSRVVIANNGFFNTEDFLAGKDAVVATDAMFEDAAEDAKTPRQFRPKAGSPLIGAGLAAVAPKDDLLGKPRAAAADLGAIQSAK